MFQLDQKKVHAYVYLLLSFVWHNHFYDICHMYGSGGGLVTKSCPTLVTPWTGACQAPLEFPRRECWSSLPFPSPGHLPNRGIEPRSSPLQADSLPSEPPGKPCYVCVCVCVCVGMYIYSSKPRARSSSWGQGPESDASGRNCRDSYLTELNRTNVHR